MATIADIVKETGLARSTVAQVLQGRPGFSSTSRKRVREAAQRLGYRPNYLSKALNGGKSMSIGMIWPMRGVTGDVDVGMAVLEQARQKGYATYQDEVRLDSGELRRCIAELADRRVDALVLWCAESIPVELREELKRFGGVVAVAGEPCDWFDGDLVVHDRYRAIGEVVDCFAASGRTRPAMVYPEGSIRSPKVSHFLDCCRTHGLSMDDRAVINLKPSTPELGIVAACQEVFKHHFRDGIDVDALLCGTDQGAMAAIRFLQDRGVRVPEDVAVVGWNNLSTDSLWRPALASIDRRREQLTATVCRMLLSRLESPSLAARRRTVHMEFVSRESAANRDSIHFSSSRRLLCEAN